MAKIRRHNITVVTEEQFKEIVKKYWLHEVERCSHEDIFSLLIEYSFPKYDIQNLDKFVENVSLFLPTLCVDFGDSMFMWLVSGRKAILVSKKDELTNIKSLLDS